MTSSPLPSTSEKGRSLSVHETDKPSPLRRSMHSARKVRIWERDGGLCWICQKPVECFGKGVRYDHRNILWVTRDDSDAAISPSHTACDAPKTANDQGIIAKIKRLIKKADPEQRKPSRLQSRGFDKTKTRKFSGKVVPR